MSALLQNRFARISGARKADPKEISDFVKVMKEKVIPSIETVVEKRRVLAATSRNKPLKT